MLPSQALLPRTQDYQLAAFSAARSTPTAPLPWPTFSPALTRNPIQVSEEIAELLVHGVMLSQRRGMSLSQLVSHPAIFPFKLQVNAATRRKHPCFRVQRQGDQSDFVELA